VNKGDCIAQFEILEVLELEELKAKGIWARHASGAELFHILNDDSENLFAFAFATPPEDSTGAAHILEHSVLCGSEHYPLKDAFLVLAQGSLQTFLNAWTFPDKTVYPASSINEKDYFNLMAVYGDAVFRPLLSEWTFMQEGHRLEAAAAEDADKPTDAAVQEFGYTGVVYNEMKGAYSSMDTYAGLWSVKAVMPGTPYAFESGGDPGCIPELSREQLLQFHRSRYSPGNCRIFLAGNIPTEKQLAFLNDTVLAGLPPGSPLPPIKRTGRWQSPQSFTIPCPGGAEEQKPQVFLSWLCSDSADTAETMALSCLAEILLGHDGSPLTRALIESGLGEDISPSSGLEGELRETVFCAGLRGVNGRGKAWNEKVEALIVEELRRLVNEGIPREEIDAALLSIEFSHREIKRSHGPYSLVWLRRSLRGWLHGTKPWESLLFLPGFTEIKRRLAADSRYFESFIEKYLLDNPHRALVSIEPEDRYLEQKDAETAEALARKMAAMSGAEKDALRQRSAELAKIQGEPEKPEALAAIPHLSRNDLEPERERVPRELRETAGLSCLVHPLFTNGISYAELAFPADILKPEDYRWLPFFSRALVSMGLPGMDYGEVSSLLSRTAGGFHAMLESGSPAPACSEDSDALSADPALLGRDWIIYRVKALDEKFGEALDLALRLITEADFSDLRRLRDLALEMKNDGDASLAPSGHGYASGRSGRFYSRSRAVDELWNGLGQIAFSHDLAALDTAELRDRMISLRDTLASKAGLFVNISASAEALPAALKAAGKFGRFGAPRPANPACRDREQFFALLANAGGTGAEVFASPSLQVGFAALSLPASRYGTPEQAAELVLSHELSTGALWESIRMMGGAYGAFASSDSLEGVFSLATYRDPEPLRSLAVFPEILKKRGAAGIDEDSLEKAIIGTFAREIRPRTPAEKGFSDFLRFLYGIHESQRRRRIEALIRVQAAETSKIAARLAGDALAGNALNGAAARGPRVIIAGTRAAAKAAKELGAELITLPV
jgi:Zn-dependent M16 (insulinase) family peptidase